MIGTQFVPQGNVITRLVGQVIVGGWVELVTVTVKLHEDEPQLFVAKQVTTVLPTGKQLPDAGVQPPSTPLLTMGSG